MKKLATGWKKIFATLKTTKVSYQEYIYNIETLRINKKNMDNALEKMGKRLLSSTSPQRISKWSNSISLVIRQM